MGTLAKTRAGLIWAVTSVSTVAAVAAFGAGQARADTIVCGQLITQNTEVDNDLLNCPGNGLVIGRNGITLDLGGHIIDGVSINTGIDNSGGFDDVEIVNGTVQQFSFGARLVGASRNKVERLTTRQTHSGIRLENSNDNWVEHNTSSENFDGLFLEASDRNHLTDNIAYDCETAGIVVGDRSDHNAVDQNRAFDNAGWGITGGGGTGNTYTRNAVFSNGNVGIEKFGSTGLVISHNYVFDNGRGIVLYDTDTSNVRGNRVWSNAEDGIQIIFGSTGNLLRHNRSAEHGDDGLEISSTGNTITKNRANRNGDLVIFAAAGNVDGGRNWAWGNVNPLQCVGVSCDRPGA